jgi:hypothetical protein
MQTSDILLPERSGSIIILYLFSIISTCYYTPRLECQPCQEAKMSTMYGSSTAKQQFDAPLKPQKKRFWLSILMLKFVSCLLYR